MEAMAVAVWRPPSIQAGVLLRRFGTMGEAWATEHSNDWLTFKAAKIMKLFGGYPKIFCKSYEDNTREDAIIIVIVTGYIIVILRLSLLFNVVISIYTSLYTYRC